MNEFIVYYPELNFIQTFENKYNLSIDVKMLLLNLGVKTPIVYIGEL